MPHVVNPDYHGHEISLTEDHRFSISGPAFANTRDHERRYESYVAACTSIDDRMKAVEKQKRSEASVAIQMLNTRGDSVTVKGIHAGTGALLGVGETEMVYPAVDWVRELLQEFMRLNERRNRIKRTLDRVSVNVSRGYGRVAPGAYDGLIEALMEEIAKKTSVAQSAKLKTPEPV